MLFFNRGKRMEAINKEIAHIRTGMLMGCYDNLVSAEKKLTKLKNKLQKLKQKEELSQQRKYLGGTIN